MPHRNGAPEPELRGHAPGHRHSRHHDDVAIVEIVLQEDTGPGRILVREQHAGAIELNVVEQPDFQLRQVGNRFDVMKTPPGEQTDPPAAWLLAEHKRPARLDHAVAEAVHAAPLSCSCNAAVSGPCHYCYSR